MSEIQTSISCTQKSGLKYPTSASPGTSLEYNQSDKAVTGEVLHLLTGNGGYSIIPNIFLDKLRGVLGRNEYDVFMYIIRRTLGFHKLSDAISLSQFQNGIVTFEGRRLDWGCGLKGADTIIRALKTLEKLGFIVRQKRIAANGGFASNVFTICPEVVARTLDGEAVTPEESAGNVVTGFDAGIDNIWDKSTSREIIQPVKVIPVEEKGQTLHDGFSLVKEGVSLTHGKPSQDQEGGLALFGRNKTKASQNKANKKSSMAAAPLANLSGLDRQLSYRLTTDTTYLATLGFDNLTAEQLALLAEKMAKPADYIASVVTYSQKVARTNPAGLARWLIEHGVERSGGSASSKSFSTRKTKVISPHNYQPVLTNSCTVASPTPGIPGKTFFSETKSVEVVGGVICKETYSPEELGKIWQEVYSRAKLRLNSCELVRVLEKATLVDVRVERESLAVFLKLEEVWQKRLFTPGSLALLELVLSQWFGNAVGIKFCQEF